MVERIKFNSQEHGLDGLIPVNKPGGMLCCGSSHYPGAASVWSACARDFDSIPVHRLDRGTSGLVLTGQNKPIRAQLSRLLNPVFRDAENKIEKNYICILASTSGETPRVESQIITTPLNNKSAESRFDLLEANRGLGIYRVQIETGRTHQIRLHAKHLAQEGHVVGDVIYGGNKNRYGIEPHRFLLHSYRKSIRRVGHPEVKIAADLPDDILNFINKRMGVPNTNFLTQLG